MLHQARLFCHVPVVTGFVLTLLGGAQSVDAASITVNFSSASSFSSGLFQGFDPALGTLDSVDVDATATRTATFLNNTGTGTNLTGSVDFNVTFFADALALSDLQSATQFLAPGGTFSLTASDSGSVLLTTGLSSFVNAGLISFLGDGTAGANASTGNISFFGGTTAGTVTYNYTPVAVPEPTTLMLLGLGLAGLRARRWRQRRAA